MRKLVYVKMIISAALLLSSSQVMASGEAFPSPFDLHHGNSSRTPLIAKPVSRERKAQRAIDELSAAERHREEAIQDGYIHLPHTYDITKRLCKINPNAVANFIQKQVIARSLIANALLVRDPNALLAHYLGHKTTNGTIIANRIAYLAITATTLYFRDNGVIGRSQLNVDNILAKHELAIQKYASSPDHLQMLRGNIRKYFDLVSSLYGSVYDDVVKPQEAKEDMAGGAPPGGPRVVATTTPAKKAPPKLKVLVDRPNLLWEGYPKFYVHILKTIDNHPRLGRIPTDANAEVAALKRAISIDWGKYTPERYEGRPDASGSYSATLVSEIESMGLSMKDANTLMDMFSLEIPDALTRWTQIKTQAGVVEQPKQQPKKEGKKQKGDGKLDPKKLAMWDATLGEKGGAGRPRQHSGQGRDRKPSAAPTVPSGIDAGLLDASGYDRDSAPSGARQPSAPQGRDRKPSAAPPPASFAWDPAPPVPSYVPRGFSSSLTQTRVGAAAAPIDFFAGITGAQAPAIGSAPAPIGLTQASLQVAEEFRAKFLALVQCNTELSTATDQLTMLQKEGEFTRLSTELLYSEKYRDLEDDQVQIILGPDASQIDALKATGERLRVKYAQSSGSAAPRASSGKLY